MIRHTVAFRLKHPLDSEREATFLADGKRILGAIPGVARFEVLEQISTKNSFRHGFSMEFDEQADYAAYDAHPDHVAFVRDRWVPEVDEFLEIDYVAYVPS